MGAIPVRGAVRYEDIGWEPTKFNLQVPQRLLAFDGRVGAVTDEDALLFHVRVEVSSIKENIGGHLWWRRWGNEQPIVFLEIYFTDGSCNSVTDFGPEIWTELNRWESGLFLWRGRECSIVWLDAEEAEAVLSSCRNE